MVSIHGLEPNTSPDLPASVYDGGREADSTTFAGEGARMSAGSARFPFAAIIGQDTLKTVFLANVVDPMIGGLLITGAKGTGKSTVVHAAEGILPEYDAVEGCPFHCDPRNTGRSCSVCQDTSGPQRGTTRSPMRIITLPLSCTEDRLIGSLDIEALLQSGRRKVQAGILGEANRNVLYVDEVNLLPDHLVDDILDAAASHWSRIEREGISIVHPADFVLVGTMNPEEGELRPQILDRFPLSVRVDTVRDPELRVRIVRHNLDFAGDPAAFCARFEQEEERLRATILAARARLASIPIEDALLLSIAETCAALKTDGQRPDIVIAQTARAIAALAGRASIAKEDMLLAADATLGHRTRDGGLLEPASRDEIADSLQARIGKRMKGSDEAGTDTRPSQRSAETSPKKAGG
jgi:Mg-chelatase subunit ChlI